MAENDVSVDADESYFPWYPTAIRGTGHDDCSICHGRMSARRSTSVALPCRHTFHVTCIRTWRDSSNTCPLCRQRLGPDPFIIRQSTGGGTVTFDLGRLLTTLHQRWTARELLEASRTLQETSSRVSDEIQLLRVMMRRWTYDDVCRAMDYGDRRRRHELIPILDHVLYVAGTNDMLLDQLDRLARSSTFDEDLDDYSLGGRSIYECPTVDEVD